MEILHREPGLVFRPDCGGHLPAPTSSEEHMMGTVRRVTRNVKRWSSASMALRWTAAAMLEAKKGFRRLKAYKQLPALKEVALQRWHYERLTSNKESLAQQAKALHSLTNGSRSLCFSTEPRGNARSPVRCNDGRPPSSGEQ